MCCGGRSNVIGLCSRVCYLVPMACFGGYSSPLFGLVPMVALHLCTDEQGALKVNFTLAALETKTPFANEVCA